MPLGSALDGAAAAGFDLVEIDVEATRDGVPVLFHPDPTGTMWTACGADAAVAALTVAELQEVRHRASDQRVPRLEEALARCVTRGLGVVLDVKASARRPPVLAHIADLVERHHLIRATMLLSDDAAACRALAGRAMLLASPEDHRLAVAGEPVSLTGRFWPVFANRFSADEAALLRHAGALVLVTVDHRRYPPHAHRALAGEDIARLRSVGVDFFLTDAPYRDHFGSRGRS